MLPGPARIVLACRMLRWGVLSNQSRPEPIRSGLDWLSKNNFADICMPYKDMLF